MKLIAEILHRPKPKHGRSSEGVIGFSFQLAIIQHQLQKLHAFEYCHLHEDRKLFKCTKDINDCKTLKQRKYFIVANIYITKLHTLLYYIFKSQPM